MNEGREKCHNQRFEIKEDLTKALLIVSNDKHFLLELAVLFISRVPVKS